MALVRQVSVSDAPIPVQREHDRPPARVPVIAIVAALVSLLVPGLGHLAVGAKRRGLLLLGLTGAIVAAPLAFGPQGPYETLALLVQPRYLAAVLVVNLALLGFRLFAVVDAARLGGGDWGAVRHQPLAALALALLLTLTTAPHLGVAWYDIVTWRTVDEVFSEAPATAPPPENVVLSRPVRLNPQVTPVAPPVVQPEVVSKETP